MVGTPREKPYFWVTSISPLLSGDDNCERKVWLKGHYSNLPLITKAERLEIYPGLKKYEGQNWSEDHTALLNVLREEYRSKSRRFYLEGQTAWKMAGTFAIVAGKMDLVTLDPNRLIDAKTGKQKDAHAAQLKIYQVAIECGALPDLKGRTFEAILRYPNDTVSVAPPDKTFKDRFFTAVRELAKLRPPDYTPSFNECQFCELVCPARITKENVVQVSEF